MHTKSVKERKIKKRERKKRLKTTIHHRHILFSALDRNMQIRKNQQLNIHFCRCCLLRRSSTNLRVRCSWIDVNHFVGIFTIFHMDNQQNHAQHKAHTPDHYVRNAQKRIFPT